MRPVTPGSTRRHQPMLVAYRRNFPWPVSAVNWSVRRDRRHRVAIGSNDESMQNNVEILYMNSTDGEMDLLRFPLYFPHPKVPTKIMFFPLDDCHRPDLLATSADFIRLWRIAEDASRVDLRCGLISNPYQVPLTSFDWNEFAPSRIGTSSMDATCKVWDIERQTVEADYPASNSAVNDIAWGSDTNFASANGDGCIRVYDIRNVAYPTMAFRNAYSPYSPYSPPIVRVAWSHRQPHYLATAAAGCSAALVVDLRFPNSPLVQFSHWSQINNVAWAPHSATQICTTGSDNETRIWDMSNMLQTGGVTGFRAELENTSIPPVEQLHWCSAQSDLIAITFGGSFQIMTLPGSLLRNGNS